MKSWGSTGTLKKGRISKHEEKFIGDHIDLGFKGLATELDRDPESVLAFIKKKVAKGDFLPPSWLDESNAEEQARFNLTFRPYWSELKQQFTEDELKLFQYHCYQYYLL